MTERETAASIDEAASKWAGRIDRGLTSSEDSELEEWLAGDERRLGALSRAEAAWIHAERAGSLGQPPEANELSRFYDEEEEASRAGFLSRRNMVFGGSALAASLAAAVFLPSLLTDERTLKTAAGEIRTFALGGGLSVTLDTASEIVVAMRQGVGKATLISGRAFFTIASSAANSFLLKTRDVALAASAGAFTVRAIGTLPLQVIVTAGRVAIDQANSTEGVPLAILRRGMEMSLPIGQRLSPSMIKELPEESLAAATQWQSGLLTFTGDTLGQAVEMFNRYGGIQLSVPSGPLAAEPITGVFRSSDAAGFATAIAMTLDARAVRAGDTITIVR